MVESLEDLEKAGGLINRIRRVPIPFWIMLGSVVVIVGGIFIVSATQGRNVEKEGRRGKTTIGQEIPVMERNHIPQNSPRPNYNSNPPTSGPHWANPAKNGVYSEELADQQIIHSLEHGYVWISYKPDAQAEVREKLERIVKEDDWKLILSPRSANDSLIALAAWGRILELDQFDEDKVQEFIKAYRDLGPEKTPN